MQRRTFLHATGLLPFIGGNIFPDNVASTGNAGNKSLPGDTKRDFFYKPVNAWAADFIPLFDKGEFQIIYLLDWRNAEKFGEGTPWYLITSKDFVHFTEKGEIIKRGSKADQDLYIFTGCAIRAEGRYHIFYTGHNPYMREKGKPIQAVMHAVSDDMVNWTKIPEHTFFSPKDKFEEDDWRDPFVFWNEEEKQYNMLLAARKKSGIPRRRGITALCSSKDLIKWEVREPFYAPDLYFTHECPDLFKMGDWWYLIFSEFTDKVRTRYRMSRSLKGPWITPERDDFDGHAFYAAKSASDGKQRFLFGWNPTRDGNKDTGNWQWGGNLVVHELYQQANGELAVKIPQTVSGAFQKNVEVAFSKGSGNYKFANAALHLTATGSFSAAVGGVMPDLCRIRSTFHFEKGTRELGLIFRVNDDLEQAYYIRLEPDKQRVVFDKWPRERWDVDQMVELERPLLLQAGKPVHMEAIIEGNKGVVYINDEVAMNFRAYDFPKGDWGFFASNGNVRVTNINIKTI